MILNYDLYPRNLKLTTRIFIHIATEVYNQQSKKVSRPVLEHGSLSPGNFRNLGESYRKPEF